MLTMQFWPFIPGQGTRHPKVMSDLLTEEVDLTVITSKTLERTSQVDLTQSFKKVPKIVRIPTLRSSKKGIIWKTLSNLLFPLSCLMASNNIPKFSIIFTAGPNPPFFAVPMEIIRLFRRGKYLALLTDMYPDVVFDLGLVKSATLRRLLTYFCVKTYKRADHIIVITEFLKKRLLEYGISEEKVSVVELAVDTEKFKPQNVNFDSIDLTHLAHKFIVLYSGSFGYMYDFNVLLNAASKLNEMNNEIHFIIRGDGDQKEIIQKMIKDLSLKNVTLLGLAPSENDVISFINLASVCVIPIKDSKGFDMTHPSKLFEFWACEKPVICCSDGEVARLVLTHNSGISVTPGNSVLLVEAIMKLYKDKDLCRNMGQKGRQLVEENFSYFKIQNKMIEVISRLAK